MARKAATTTKKRTVKAPVQASVKAATKKRITKGDSYVCSVCGLAVTVERVGNVAYYEESPILCCSKAMKAKKPKAKVKAKASK